jgi:site-specific DNA-cytosine methylase
MGYFRAGFDVDGVDVRKVEGYPFDFVQGDAVQYILEHGREYDAIHMSPPCQARCNLTRGTNWEWFGNSYPDLIDAARAAAETTGRRWVLENVPGFGDSAGLDAVRGAVRVGCVASSVFRVGWLEGS